MSFFLISATCSTGSACEFSSSYRSLSRLRLFLPLLSLGFCAIVHLPSVTIWFWDNLTSWEFGHP